MALSDLGKARWVGWGAVVRKQRSCGRLNAAAKLLQSCPNLWDPTEGLLPGSSFPVILQERTLEWVAFYFSNA